MSKTTCPICSGVKFQKVRSYFGKASFFSDKTNILLKCSNCELVFMEPMPTELQLENFYKTYWSSHNPVQSASKVSLLIYKSQMQSRYEFLKARIGSLNNLIILDYGAGHGLFRDTILSNEQNIKYYAVEADNKIVQQLKSNGVNAFSQMNELQNVEFDIIVAFHVMEHLLDSKAFIENLLKRLKKNGLLYIEVPNMDYLWKENLEPHILFYNESSLKFLFESLSLVGFEIISCGRKLENIPNEIKTCKTIRKKVIMILRYCGLLKPKISEKVLKDLETYREVYEIDDFGEERQWLRAIIKNN